MNMQEIEVKREKLRVLSSKWQKSKLLFQWAKTGAINSSTFMELVGEVRDESVEELYESE